MPPHTLILAPGALVMLLRNLDPDAGLCNGVRAIVIRALPRVLDVLLISGSKAGDRVYLPRLVLAPKNPDLPFVLRRRQFPVKLAWCMTFNKAQGQTLKQVGLFLSTPVFSHGQFYVGLSRAGSSKAVKVLVEDHDAQGYYEGNEDIPDGVYTANVVWKEALLQAGDVGQDLGMDDSPRLPSQDSLPGPPGTPLASPGVSTECADANLGAPETPLRGDSPSGGSLSDSCETPLPSPLMAEEYFDALSGAPQTPRPGDLEQRLDRHGTSDLDEFGSAPGCSAETDVNLLASANTNQTFIDLTTSEEPPPEWTHDEADMQANMLPGLLEDLEKRAQFYDVGPSEWYEVSRRTLPEIVSYMEALERVSSRGASSTG